MKRVQTRYVLLSRRNQWKAGTATVLLSALIIADCCTNSYGPKPDPNHPAANPAVLAVGFVFVTGLLQPLLPALILLLACAGLGGPYGVLAKALSIRPLKWVADVSYDVYLLHPLLIMGVWSVLPPSEWFNPKDPRPFFAVTCLACVLSLVTGSLHGKAVQALTSVFTSRPIQKVKAQ